MFSSTVEYVPSLAWLLFWFTCHPSFYQTPVGVVDAYILLLAIAAFSILQAYS